MFERIKNWLIRKLGGVPRDAFDEAVDIASKARCECVKLISEQRKTVPVFARVNTDRLQGRSVPPYYVEMELARMISNQLFACNFLSFESRDGETTAMIEVVDRRQPYGGHNS